jgi:hypothetical protein
MLIQYELVLSSFSVHVPLRCYTLDVLCDGLQDCGTALDWIRKQQQQQQQTEACLSLPQADLQQLLSHVTSRCERRAMHNLTDPPKSSHVSAQPKTSALADKAIIEAACNSFCVMTGELLDPPESLVDPAGMPEASQSIVAGVSGSEMAEDANLWPKPWLAKFISAFSRHFGRVQGAEIVSDIVNWLLRSGGWQKIAGMLTAALLAFAFVAETQALTASARRWWRLSREAIRRFQGNLFALLAMGLSFTPNPTNMPSRPV